MRATRQAPHRVASRGSIDNLRFRRRRGTAGSGSSSHCSFLHNPAIDPPPCGLVAQTRDLERLQEEEDPESTALPGPSIPEALRAAAHGHVSCSEQSLSLDSR